MLASRRHGRPQREKLYECPQAVVNAARSVWSDWRRRNVTPNGARMARFVFDSWMQPLAIGIRGAGQPARRLIAKRGPWTVDLRMEPDARHVMLMEGQVSRIPSSRSLPENIEILLTGGGDTDHTGTNAVGEFQLQYQA